MADGRIVFGAGTVSRPAHWWTPTVHALLRHLRENGFEGVPGPIDLTDDRETLTWLEGVSGSEAWPMIVPELGLRAFARFLRRYHEASAGFVLPAGGRWAFGSGPAGPGEVICHGDFAPWNVVWCEGEPVGLVDFDFAGPGDPLQDVAYALEYAAPFCSDEEATRWRAYPFPPDRPRRIEVFANAYGLESTEDLVDAVIAHQQLDIERVRELADAGVEPQRTWVNEGMLASLEAKVEWSRQHRSSFLR